MPGQMAAPSCSRCCELASPTSRLRLTSAMLSQPTSSFCSAPTNSGRRNWAATSSGCGGRRRARTVAVRARRGGTRRETSENESKKVYDAFFLGKALAETINDRVGSAVGEFLSDVGRRQAEQRKKIREFQYEVRQRAEAAGIKAAQKARAIEKEVASTAPPPASPSRAQPPPSTSGLSSPSDT